ncbi:DNA cytosine methyltransferase [Sphingomonas kaistensis]|uniref:DNA (cytosine-5-)-methyltransferase n=1 Tax=Sphingomonas kaistensis TaxID=298708 RepID=A0ABZ2FZZ0_9SPHN
MRSFEVVDLFAGPGGLAEGFSAYKVDGAPAFKVRLSVEKEASAFATLRLRSFTRQFGGSLPEAYYAYVAGELPREELGRLHPQEWQAACEETHQLELGQPSSAETIDPLLDAIRERSGAEVVLVGGPPCQAYSLVGRARNLGKQDYDAAADQRHFLYREYIRILERLQPAAFIMENVKGFLSSAINGERIFDRVLRDLRAAGPSPESYLIIPLVEGYSRSGQEYVVKAERHGVPQARHRVILFGVRADIAAELDLSKCNLALERNTSKVEDVLRSMPRLRSGLSRSVDDPQTWRLAVTSALMAAESGALRMGTSVSVRVAECLARHLSAFKASKEAPPRKSTELASVSNNSLAAWLVDPRLTRLLNHEARGHMQGDLARYAYAAAFAETQGRSPKADEYPSNLAPQHANWLSGKFADRFRVQCWDAPATTITSHISKDGHYFIHPDVLQCRSLTVREAARLQTFPDNYFFEGNRTEQYVQVGNAVPPLLAYKIAETVYRVLASRSGGPRSFGGKVAEVPGAA